MTVELVSALAAGPFDDDLQPHLDDLWRTLEPAVDKVRRDLSGTRMARDAFAGAFTEVAA